MNPGAQETAKPVTLATLARLAILAGLSGGGCAQPTVAEVFAEEVVPVLEKHCSAASCHGVSPGAVAAGEQLDPQGFYFDVDGQGRIADLPGARRAALRAAAGAEPPQVTPLFRKALPVALGGLPHFGGAAFVTLDDPGAKALRKWLALEPPSDPPPPLSPLELRFAEQVEPVLLASGCANANCHGRDAAVPFRLDAGVSGVRGVAQVRHNHAEALSMLALIGDPRRSRLLRKALPLHAGGIVHKGGNNNLLSGLNDERVAPVVDWACQARVAMTGVPCPSPEASAAPSTSGLVFVSGPLRRREVFDLDAWSPGTHIWHATLDGAAAVAGPLNNLTAPLHGGQLDARDPAIDDSGTQMAFSLRTRPDRGHRIALLDLASGSWRYLTDPGLPLAGGQVLSDRDPTWGPQGHIWFVSNRAGVVADGGRLLDAELYELDPSSGALTRRTYTPHIERKPVFFAIGAEAGGEVSFTALRDVFADQRRAHPFRFPPGLATEYHQHFGITPPERLFYDMRELPDGRYVATVGELDTPWRGGGLAVIDRNFGPELPPGNTTAPGLPLYAEPLARLGPGPQSGDATLVAWYRDPAPLPDGRVLVSVAPTAGRDAKTAAPDLRIEVLELVERPDGGGPRIASHTVVVDRPGFADRDPEPIGPRRPVPVDPQRSWNPDESEGLLRHQGLPLIDALLGNLPPGGAKVARTDMRTVRLIEALPTPPSVLRPLTGPELPFNSGSEVGDRASTTSLTGHGPARILAELPLAADGSFQARIPAGVPFRIDALDAAGMRIGTPHNRWFYLAPGQVMTQGVPSESVYSARCAACHGALDGEPTHAFVAPDIITTASVTLSSHQGRDPRRPLPPPALGDATRMRVDFQHEIRPLLDRSCAVSACHAGPSPSAGLDLSATPTARFDRGYEGLLERGEGSVGGYRFVDGAGASARGSYLLEHLGGQELAAPRACPAPGVPHPLPGSGVPALSQAELKTLARWIELGASWSDGREEGP